MAREMNKLKADSVDAARWDALTGDQRLTDGGGLSLLVRQHSKVWRFRYRHPGTKRPNELSLGTYPEVTLKQARSKLAAARAMVENGVDPSEHRQSTREAAKAAHDRSRAKAPDSFKCIAETYLHRRKALAASTLSGEFQRLEAYLLPAIGSLPIGDVTVPQLVQVLEGLSTAGKHENVARVRSLVGRIMRFAAQRGHKVQVYPGSLNGAVERPPSAGFAAIVKPEPFGALLRAIDTYSGQPVTRLALKILPYVFVRPGELRGATWAEFQLEGEAPVWVIPVERMKIRGKDRGDHLVPLAPQVVEMLEELRPHTDGRLMFPSLRPGRPISENTLNMALRGLGYAGDVHVAHGFRKSASTMLHEQGYRPEWIEAQLAHMKKDAVASIYNKAAYLADRRQMMLDWAAYLDGLRADLHKGPDLHKRPHKSARWPRDRNRSRKGSRSPGTADTGA